jgi:leucyl-tRNA---protein transferase
MNKLQELRFFASVPHACSYLPGREARTVFVDPEQQKTPAIYSALAKFGFRRSGDEIYAPHCNGCSECVSVRVPVTAFKPRRIHKRTAKRNADLDICIRPARYSEEHYRLYLDYQRARHADSSMAEHTEQDYRNFLLCTWSETWLIEMRAGDELLAVGVLDELDHGWSCVYTFFAPHAAARSLGTLAVLTAIEHARVTQRPWVYLGYWIADCDKMAYKDQFYPQQRLLERQWSDWNGPSE